MGSEPLPPLEALRHLFRQVLMGNSFYQRKLSGAGVVGIPESIEMFRTQVPFTTKSELVADQLDHPPYGTNLSVPLAHYTRCHQTSGTSGHPLRWLDTPDSWSAMTDDWAEVLRAAGVTREDRVLFAFSFGPFLGFWLAFEAAQTLGCLCIAGGGMSTSLRARVLLEHQCTVLCCTPTYALHLAETGRRDGLPLNSSALRLIVVAGEPGGSQPATRQHLSNAWNGARVFDHHGMTEVGPVTYEDPSQPGQLRVLARSFFSEVCDPITGESTPENEPGELVLTTLRRSGSPLIRYRTGDLVCAHWEGEQLVLRGGILGRVDDMVIVRGVNVYPSALEELVRADPSIKEYRVTLDTRKALPELFVEIEGDTHCAQQLERRIQDALTLRVPVHAVPPELLPRFEFKARRWRRLEAA